MSVASPTVPNLGEELAGIWTVERILSEEQGVRALLATSRDGARALCFLLPPGAPDPDLDEEAAAAWGTSRTVLRDDRFGRVCIDEVGEGPLLADRLAEGWSPPPAWLAELRSRIEAQHRAGRGHGRILPEAIVLAPGEPQLAGWGLVSAPADDLRALDLAALGRLEAMASSGEEAAAPTLAAAIRSEQIPLLVKAIEAAERAEEPPDPAELDRARDALRRLEARLEASLAQARESIEAGDPLGAVAACREAIHLGAEAEAAPLLREARRQARRLLRRRRPLPSAAVLARLAVPAVLAAAAFLWWALPGASAARRLAEELASKQGERAACRLLLAMRERGELGGEGEALLEEHLGRLVTEERSRLVALRAAAIAQGARPRRADAAAEAALAELERLAAAPGTPDLDEALRAVLAGLDRAAFLYRATLHLGVSEAQRAVELLVAHDPLFRGEKEGPR